jgi:hypothetical protein
VNWFLDEFRANVKEANRTWKRRLLRRFVAILLVVLITPVGLLVRHLTGSAAAGAVVAVPLLVLSIFVWWWIEDWMYEKADARYFASLEAMPPPTATHGEAPVYGRGVAPSPTDYLSTVPAVAPAKPTSYFPPKPAIAEPARRSGGTGWAIFAIVVVGSVLLMCSGVVVGGALLVSRATQQPPQAFAVDPLEDIRRRQQQQIDDFAQRNRDMHRQIERDRERMRRPGW